MMKTTINNKEYSLSGELSELNLLKFLREKLGLTGTKNGCEIGVCGACTVLIDNIPVRSCRKKVADIVDRQVLTIEGMENPDGTLCALQQAFLDCGAIQCGFCTPGMVLTAHALLLRNNEPTEQEIKDALKGNLCRCTGYAQIVEAVKSAAKSKRGV
jgi:carbon-monoxide dehydrogenase small subunit